MTPLQPSVAPPSAGPAEFAGVRGGPPCCVSIDVEEYFHIEAAQGTIPRERWDQWPSRVEGNVQLLLDLFDRHKIRGTFFFLGVVAARHPRLAPRVAAAGHEIASHGTGHQRLHRLEPASFRRDLCDSRKLLEDQVGRAVLGYRAPTFSVVPRTAWAIDVLVEAGLQYDASIFPVTHPQYGVPQAPDRPFLVRGRTGGPTILEVPPLTWSPAGPLARCLCRGRKLAVAGGGYFRLLPLWFMKKGLSQAAATNRPAVLYFHPWEFDPDMPRMPLPRVGRLRTYTGLRAAAAKLDQIMSRRARWTPIAEVLPELRAQAEARPVYVLG